MSNTPAFYAINPASGEKLGTAFSVATEQEMNDKIEKAVAAFDIYRKKDNDSRADFLNKIADEIINLGEQLINTCHLETALPVARLEGERGRTVNQLRLFASVVKEGSWVDARIDTALPDRAPVPKPDIRHMLVPLGPVAIFGASNFPLAFSVGGGDTASALASGCPVIVKAHPAHPETSKLVADAFIKAAKKCNMPEGTFSLVQGNTNDVGEFLVKHPSIKAVGFTGSYRGGKALFDLANSRPEPIPVFAEMGSTNPVFILPHTLKENSESIAMGMATSISMGVGQFCTKPGLTFVQQANELNTFNNTLKEQIKSISPGTMLTSGIKDAYEKGTQQISNLDKVEEFATGKLDDKAGNVQAKVFKTTLETYEANKILAEENFGPSNVLIEANNKEQILAAARNLDGHLTATVHGTPKDLEEYEELLHILENKVGRIVINGYPTGVEVCHSMVHGGPFPATTAPQSTSVGTNAIKRFARPVCYQGYPDALLPDALKNSNPSDVWRLLDGELSKAKNN